MTSAFLGRNQNSDTPSAKMNAMSAKGPRAQKTHCRPEFLPKSLEKSWGRNSERPESKLFLIDWDDTLNPSSWCMRNGILTVRPPRRDEVSAVACLSTKVIKTLTYCMDQGEVVIITNAESGWVEMSARFLMPEVSKLLKQIPVISARSSFESFCRDSPITWKSMAFSRVISEWADRSRTESEGFSVPTQVVSIGDSSHEREALFRVHSQHLVKFSAKSVKLIERPTISDLERQHEALHSNLSSILKEESNRDLRYQHGQFVLFTAPLTSRRPQSISNPLKQRRTVVSFPAFGSPSAAIQVGGRQRSSFSRGN